MKNENFADTNSPTNKSEYDQRLEKLLSYIKDLFSKESETTGMTLSALSFLVKNKIKKLNEKRQSLENYNKLIEENTKLLALLETKIYYSKNKDLMLKAYEILFSKEVFTQESSIFVQLQIPVLGALTRKKLKNIVGNEIDITPPIYLKNDIERLTKENSKLYSNINSLKREISIDKKNLILYKNVLNQKILNATDEDYPLVKEYYIHGKDIIQDQPVKKK